MDPKESLTCNWNFSDWGIFGYHRLCICAWGSSSNHHLVGYSVKYQSGTR